MRDEYFRIPVNVWFALAISVASTIALLFLPSMLTPKTVVKTVQIKENSPKHALIEQKKILEELEKEAKEIREKCTDKKKKNNSYND